MEHHNTPREIELPDADPESIRALMNSIAIATTDPIIERLAAYQPEWKRHPDATTVVATNQVDEPSILPLQHPETTSDGESRHVLPTPSVTEECGDWNAGLPDRLVDPVADPPGQERNLWSGDPKSHDGPWHTRPLSLDRLLMAAGVVLIVGAIALVGYRSLFLPRLVKNPYLR